MKQTSFANAEWAGKNGQARRKQAWRQNPARWSGAMRDWPHIDVVAYSPKGDYVVSMAASAQLTQPQAA